MEIELTMEELIGVGKERYKAQNKEPKPGYLVITAMVVGVLMMIASIAVVAIHDDTYEATYEIAGKDGSMYLFTSSSQTANFDYDDGAVDYIKETAQSKHINRYHNTIHKATIGGIITGGALLIIAIFIFGFTGDYKKWEDNRREYTLGMLDHYVNGGK